MALTYVFVFAPLIIALVLLLWKRRGMKKYIATGLFSSWAAYSICAISMHVFNLWTYPIQYEEVIVDGIVIPIFAMIWVRYAPDGTVLLIVWSLLWTIPLTILEYFGEKYSDVIKYHNGYDWYYSMALWFISWFVWYSFHKWFTKDTISTIVRRNPS